jgi:hypothetical protein
MVAQQRFTKHNNKELTFQWTVIYLQPKRNRIRHTFSEGSLSENGIYLMLAD